MNFYEKKSSCHFILKFAAVVFLTAEQAGARLRSTDKKIK